MQKKSPRGDELQERSQKGFTAAWLRLTAPPGTRNYENAETRSQRERLRHAGHTSFVAPFVFFAPLLLLQQAIDPITLIGIVLLMTMSCISLILNRFGRQTLAALLLILSMDAVIEGTLITAKGGLGSAWLPTFALFVLPLFATGVLLSSRYIVIFMIIHIVCILGDFFLLPHTQDLQTMIQVWGQGVAYARPIVIQVVAAALCYALVASNNQAIKRAEKAEFVSKLQEQIRIEKATLEFGINEILKMLTDAANGKYTVQAQLPQESTLWKIVHALNMLFGRLKNARQLESRLQHEQEEVILLRAAMRAAKSGQRPLWPRPSGGILDPILQELHEGPSQYSPSQFSPSSNPPEPKKPFPQARTMRGTGELRPPQ